MSCTALSACQESGKCRAAFSREACGASALSSPRSTITRLPSGASSSRLHRHLHASRLASRHFPPLHVALPAFGSRAAPNSRRLFVVRCAMLSRMHAVWFRAEYRPSPSGTPSRSLSHPAEFTPLILLSRFTSLRARYTSRHSRFLSAALCSALWPRVALT